jgi:hypothetical protein
MKLIKVKNSEWDAIKKKILDSLKRVELNILLHTGEIQGVLPLVEGYRAVIEDILNSFDSKNKEKVLRYFRKGDISGMITEESHLDLGEKAYKDLQERISSDNASKTGIVSCGSLADFLPLSKLEVIAQNILDALVNMREYTAFLLLPNIDISSDFLEINQTFSLIRVTEDLLDNYPLPKEWEDFSWEKNKIYLSVKEPGFVGGLEPSLTVYSLLNKLKIFIGLALIQSIFKAKETSWGYFSVAKQATPINLGIFGPFDEDGFFFPFKRPHKLSESFTNLIGDLVLTDEATKPSHDLQRLGSAQEYLEDKFTIGLKGILQAEDSFAERIKTASEWYFESLCTENDTFKIIQMTTAIEALLGEGKEQVTERLADRCSFLLGESQQERLDIRTDFLEIYDIRSKTIHRGKIMLSEKEYAYLIKLREILENAIRKEIEHHSNINKGETLDGHK